MATGAAATSTEKVRLPGVGEKFLAGDPLRALCAIMVVSSHIAYQVGGAQRWPHGQSLIAHYGEIPGSLIAALAFSVFMFLGLSGYLVGRPFLRSFVLGTRLPRIRPYAQNRIVRIMPLFVVVWTATWVRHRDGGPWSDVIEPYLFLQIYDPSPLSRRMVHAWTVDVEVVFYLTLPLIVFGLAALMRRAKPWARAAVVLGLLTAASAVSLKVRAGYVNEPGFFWPQALVFAFAPGLALATLEPLLAPVLRRRGEARWLVGALLAIAAVAFIPYVLMDPPDPYRSAPGAIVAGALLAAPLVHQWATAGAWRPLVHPALNWVGERSYSVYMVHVLVMIEWGRLAREFDSAWAPYALLVVLTWAVVLPLSALTYRWIEVPFLKLKLDRGGFARPQPAGAKP